MATKPISKTKKSTCSYSKETMLEQNIRRHTWLHHSGKEVLVKGEPHITSFFQNKEDKKSLEFYDNKCENDSETQQQSSSVINSAPSTSKNNDESNTVCPVKCTNDDKLDEILDRIKDIQISVGRKETSVTIPTSVKSKDIKPSDERLDQLILCRSG